MDFKQMEAFCAVVEEKSFSRAARRLHLAQPTVSAHLSSLEAECATRLVMRGADGAFTTPAGRLLYAEAKKLLDGRKELTKRLASFEKEQKGEISLAASSAPHAYFLANLAERFAALYPEISFAISETDSAGVIEAVEGLRAELGLCGTLFRSTKCLFTPFAKDRLLLIAPNNEKYRAFQNSGFPLNALLAESFFMREPGSGTRKESEFFLKEMGLDPGKLKVAAELPATALICEAVAQAKGIAFVSASAAQEGIRTGKILGLDLAGLRFERPLYLVRHKNMPLSPPARLFAAFATEEQKGNIRKKDI